DNARATDRSARIEEGPDVGCDGKQNVLVVWNRIAERYGAARRSFSEEYRAAYITQTTNGLTSSIAGRSPRPAAYSRSSGTRRPELCPFHANHVCSGGPKTSRGLPSMTALLGLLAVAGY